MRKMKKSKKTITMKRFMRKLKQQQTLSKSISKIFIAQKEVGMKKKTVDPLMLRSNSPSHSNGQQDPLQQQYLIPVSGQQVMETQSSNISQSVFYTIGMQQTQ